MDEAPKSAPKSEPAVIDAAGLLLQALEEARTPRPSATYRVQLNAGFTFRDALAIVPYLDDLGVSHLYTSPFLRAVPGSAHGYDVVDHNQLNPEIGTEEDLTELSSALSARGMGVLVDVVPNHVGIGHDNAKWLDVLENGPSSIHGRFFDIDWTPLKRELASKVLLPILGDHYGMVLERGELKLSYENGSFWIAYWDERLPIAPRPYALILRHGLDELEASLGQVGGSLVPSSAALGRGSGGRAEGAATSPVGGPSNDPHLQELLSILTAIENLPPRSVVAPAKILERHREKEIIKRRLATLYEASEAIRAHVDGAVAAINGTPGEPASFDLLEALLDAQPYRLAYWRVAGEEINYRRFFDINALAAIRQEDGVVFEETHRLLLRLLREKKIGGMRIDHPDGLYDPAEYLRSLQEEVVAGAARGIVMRKAATSEEGEAEWKQAEASIREVFRRALAEDPRDPMLRPLYVVVEKILSRKERIPTSWAIEGTTGYEFLNLLNGLFVDRANEDRLDASYRRFVGAPVDLHALVRKNKTLILKTSMVSELNVLAHRLSSLSERNRRTRDFTLNSLRHALIAVVAGFPIYRTYVDGWVVDERDQAFIEQAFAEARRAMAETNAPTLDFLRDILTMQPILGPGEDARREQLSFVMKLQQVTGPVMAKGLEDTTFYAYNRLISLNEVGGEPERFGVTIEAFHRQNESRAKRWPASLLATSTHDTKRSEDVRARINVLSELPDAWERFLTIAREVNEARKVRVGERLAPDGAEEVLLYQTMLGAASDWPPSRSEAQSLRARIEAYMLKAVKEAKVNNSWVNQNPEYDEAIRQFVRALFDAPSDDPFSEEMRILHRKVVRVGRINALAQQLLKIAVPGVPDVYQGTELWDFSLVDPDNRRPVDYSLRIRLMKELLDRLGQGDDARLKLARELIVSPLDPRLKLYVTREALRARRASPSLFLSGAYVPLDVVGTRSRNVCAFARVLSRPSSSEGDASGAGEGRAEQRLASEGRAEQRLAVVVVPRLVGAILGDRRAWDGTFVTLPDEVSDLVADADGTLYDLFTGQQRRTVRREGGAALSMPDLMNPFPVAMLMLDPPPT